MEDVQKKATLIKDVFEHAWNKLKKLQKQRMDIVAEFSHKADEARLKKFKKQVGL